MKSTDTYSCPLCLDGKEIARLREKDWYKVAQNALEQMQCAMANMENMKLVNPEVGSSPFFRISMMQLEETETILKGRCDDE